MNVPKTILKNLLVYVVLIFTISFQHRMHQMILDGVQCFIASSTWCCDLTTLSELLAKVFCASSPLMVGFRHRMRSQRVSLKRGPKAR